MTDMTFIRSCFVQSTKEDFELPSLREPPDKWYRNILRLKIRSFEITRKPKCFSSSKKELDWDCEENKWTKDEDGNWKMPDNFLEPSTLADDPIHSYDSTAQHNNIVMRVTNAPETLPSASSVDQTIHIDYNEQSDTGANACITPHLNLLDEVRWFAPVTIGNAQEDSGLQVSAIGKFKLVTSTGIRLINMYYSPNATNTIVSPTAICHQHPELIGYHQWSNVKTNEGMLTFVDRYSQPIFLVAMSGHNGLWFHTTTAPDIKVSSIQVNALSDAAKWELWHQRLAHCGSWAMENAHKHVIGIPPLRGNSFYRCPSCMVGKLCTKRSNNKRNRNLGTVLCQPVSSNPQPDLRDTTVIEEHLEPFLDDIHLPDANPGQHFHIDFGFVRGSEFREKNEITGKTVTSIDQKNSYLLIVDRKTRYMWIYNSSSKEPPLEAIKHVLTKFGSKDTHRTVRTDQDRGLGKSKDFLQLLTNLNFTPELTGTDNSQQNSRAERPHRDLGQMMRCLLHSANLGPEYWTYALTMAVYVKNRIPHKSLKMTPYEAFTGRKPDLSRLRIFGSRVTARKTGIRPAKLDMHCDTGIFLCFSATDANAYFIDDATGLVKLGTHLIFDEAHMSVPARKAPLAAQALQRVGYYNREQWIDDAVRREFSADSQNEILVHRLKPDAILPTRGTPDSIGLDLHSNSEDHILEPGDTHIFTTGISAKAPPGSYLRVAPRSGLTVKRNINSLAGVIDPDYTGDIGVVLHNFGKQSQTIKKSERIAQLIVERAASPTIRECNNLTSTGRGAKGFGSTDKIPSSPPIRPTPADINLRPTAAAAAAVDFANASSDLQVSLDLPYDIDLDSSPFDTFTTRTIPIKGSDETLGMDLEYCGKFGKVKLKHCRRSTPSARLTRWRSELRNGYIHRVNDRHIDNIADVKEEIAKSRSSDHPHITVTFAIIDTVPIHAEKGLPQLFFDQLNVIGKHLFDLKHDPAYNEKYATILGHDDPPTDLPEDDSKLLDNLKSLIVHKVESTDLAKKRGKLSRRILMECSDWEDWEKSEHKQLDQYDAQNTFGPPQSLPKGANVLNLLWTYLIKDDGRKKARCVCNGSKKMRGSVTLAETYAAALEQTGSRIFWAATAINNFICIGADAANAFAEAPAPVAPLYVRIDDQYREWYSKRYPDKPPIPKGHVMKVMGALQGHPESARLWAILIDKVIQQLNLKPCTHEPNLYYTTNYRDTGKTVLFLRQVDDFAISCEDKATARDVITSINDKMTIDVKELGMISRFNGVDVTQSRNFVRLSNATYLRKIFLHHTWLKDEHPLTKNRPIPMSDSASYQRKLEDAIPLTPEELDSVEKEMGFTYRQAIGELIYALVTCRPDISFACIKLSQFSAKPARIHFDAVKHVYKYLLATIDRGITYWRRKPNMDLPFVANPDPELDSNYDEAASKERLQKDEKEMIGAVDSDYAGDNSHRKSVSGIVIKLAGGVILYKTQYQATIALSTTEAEFTAACEAGKYILYVRTILQEIGLEQQQATILYEDNQGALLMANAQRPTKRTRHMDVKHFAIQQWVANDLLTMKRISTSDNYADVLTKATGRILFYRHMDYIMGYIRPQYMET
jgi:deoxyuridine 5'-triphosphate nucleotidohydrolase